MTNVATPVASPGTSTSPVHPWMLVAPWWFWGTQTGHGRTSHPALQKYETPDVVNTFLGDPQLRLEFQSSVDEVVTITPASTPLGLPTRVTTGQRKLYLNSHHRYYLVTCELHCDATGFPPVSRDQICQAGFVVRRRLFDIAVEERETARKVVKRLSSARQRLAGVERELVIARSRNLSSLKVRELGARREAASQVLAQHQEVVRQWAQGMGVFRRLQGWAPQGKDAAGNYVDAPACAGGPGVTPAPSPLSGVGRWANVDELPTDLQEAWYPLSPLVADPTDPQSDAAGATIYFGLVPTGSSDVDRNGTARYDDDSTYEIRCFVRQHKAVCPRTGPQCHCPITWSDPTESYRLATHFDVQGSANRPVTIQLPDLNQLQADALTLPAGSTGGVQLKAPQSLMATASFPPGGSLVPTGEICSFSIPLITIVATFVFKLFLPIVVLAFQLWFMLLLKFCIPPEVKFDVGLSAALAGVTSLSDDTPAIEAEIGPRIDSLMSGANLGAGPGTPSQLMPTATRLLLAKQLFSAPINPVPPSDLVFAAHVDRKSVVP